MDVISPKLRKLWKECDLRIFVLLSLTLQIILVILGSTRKYSPKPGIRIAVWCAYMAADSIAILGIGTLSSDLAEIYASNGSLNPNVELSAFWAPFLLLHLGGPDTITAYALEDNNLWLRHFLGLAVQTIGTVYILLMSWTGSHLSILSSMMLLAGFIKYSERVWVLRQASYEQLRDSPPDPAPNYSKLMEVYYLKMAEGYEVKRDEVTEAKGAVDLSLFGSDSGPDVQKLLKAYGLLQRFRGLFVDLLLRVSDRDTSGFIFKDIDFKEAFKIVEIELGFMYDLLYTKATLLSSSWGWGCRIISFSLTFSVLVVFSLVENHKYRKVDLVITFILLSVAVLLESYSILRQLFSDRAIVWLCMHKKLSLILRAINSPQRFERTRWSDSMAQFSLISFSGNQNPIVFSRILNLIDQKVEKHPFVTYEEISPDLRESIFNHLKEKLEESRGKADIKQLCTYRGGSVLKKFNCSEFNCFKLLGWSTSLEFDQSILIWHIATELCHYRDIQDEAEAEVEAAQAQAPVQAETEAKAKAKAIAIAIIAKAKAEAIAEAEAEAIAEAKAEAIAIIAKAKPETEAEKFREMSKHLSRYMLYLLVMYPSMLPTRIGQIRFRDTSAEAMNLLKQKPIPSTLRAKTSQFIDLLIWAVGIFGIRKRMPEIFEACNKLLEEKLKLPVSNAEGDRRNSVLFDACKLALQLQKMPNKEEKWKMVREVWLEILTYAANQCSGNKHAQQLRRGGELLTHVWLLMAHLGISEQFQMTEGQVIAKIIVK